mgnify:CR=1 FL=1
MAAPSVSGAASSGSGGDRPDGDGPVTVRLIRPDEGPRLRDVRLAAIADSPGTFATDLETARSRPDDAWVRVAGVHAEADEQATWFAEKEGATAGMVSAFRTDDGAVTMTSLWSAPGFRQIGVAEELVGAVRSWAESRQAREIRQWLVERNAHARDFHARQGFVPTGAERRYEPAPELREVELRLPLADAATGSEPTA